MSTAARNNDIAVRANAKAALGGNPELPSAYAFAVFAALLAAGALWLWLRTEPGWLRWLCLALAIWLACRLVAGLFFVGHAHALVRANREWAERLTTIRSEMAVRLRQDPQLRARVEAFVHGIGAAQCLIYSPPTHVHNGQNAMAVTAKLTRLSEPLPLRIDGASAIPAGVAVVCR